MSGCRTPCATLRPAGVKRAAEIVKYASRNEVDLIVLSSHRIEKIHPAEGWATISYRVAILAHCPVMMVK